MHNLRRGVGLEMAFRRVQILNTISTNLNFWSPSSLFVSSLWFKQRIGTRVQRDLHLFDKMLVATESWIGRKERMWERRVSGRVLIMSVSVLVVRAFCRADERHFLCVWSLLAALSVLSILCLPLLCSICSILCVSLCGILSDWVKGSNTVSVVIWLTRMKMSLCDSLSHAKLPSQVDWKFKWHSVLIGNPKTTLVMVESYGIWPLATIHLFFFFFLNIYIYIYIYIYWIQLIKSPLLIIFNPFGIAVCPWYYISLQALMAIC